MNYTTPNSPKELQVNELYNTNKNSSQISANKLSTIPILYDNLKVDMYVNEN